MCPFCRFDACSGVSARRRPFVFWPSYIHLFSWAPWAIKDSLSCVSYMGTLFRPCEMVFRSLWYPRVSFVSNFVDLGVLCTEMACQSGLATHSSPPHIQGPSFAPKVVGKQAGRSNVSASNSFFKQAVLRRVFLARSGT